MTDEKPKTENTATGSQVGIQANEVHNSTVYQLHQDASPEEKYRVGLAYLRDGVPSEARRLIQEAKARGYDSAEVEFHWVLAMLSKRSYRDLTPDERKQLATMPITCANLPVDDWTQSLNAVCEFLEYFSKTGSDPGHALKELEKLPADHREMIVRHLDLVLTGSLRDTFWADTRQNAERMRFADKRQKSVWAYFQPDPIPPRARGPAPSTTTLADRARAAIGTLASGPAIGYLVKTTILASRPLPIFACLLATAAAYVVAKHGVDWGYRRERLSAEERRHRSRRGSDPGLDSIFAHDVDESFDRYFVKYRPEDVKLKKWLNDTKGFRAALRDEVVELYREKLFTAGRVNWLIRYLTRDTVARWAAGTLHRYRDRYRVTAAMKARCVVSGIAFVGLSAYVVSAALRVAILPNAAATFVAVVGVWVAGAGWSHILQERRRIKEGELDHDKTMSDRQAEYDRWVRKLKSTRPNETQMEKWLTADKIMVLDETLKHYRLAWRDVLTHAFLQAPGRDYKRARDPFGPWRYSKYDIRIFLITQEGVREVSVEMDFEHAKRNGQERNNYRFDAVSSVHVATPDDLSSTLELTLMNGPSRNIRVTDPAAAADKAAPGQNDPRSLARMGRDAAGFSHTLHILEGIAAEGKKWIERDPFINDQPSGGLPTDPEPDTDPDTDTDTDTDK